MFAKLIERILPRWKYRNTDTGRFISKAAYDLLPENRRAKSLGWGRP